MKAEVLRALPFGELFSFLTPARIWSEAAVNHPGDSPGQEQVVGTFSFYKGSCCKFVPSVDSVVRPAAYTCLKTLSLSVEVLPHLQRQTSSNEFGILCWL